MAWNREKHGTLHQEDDMVKIRDTVKNMSAYVPGAAAEDPAVVKLNQNESRYAPSRAVLEAVAHAAAGSLELYPDSTSSSLREAAAELYGVDPMEVMATNGSDEMLRLLIEATCGEGSKILTFTPTYTYYSTLAAMVGATTVGMPLHETGDDFLLPSDPGLAGGGGGGKPFSLVILPNPNAPTGTLFPERDLRQLIEAYADILVVVDEAYADFSGYSAIPLIREYPNLAVARTFSKSYALAGLRIGLGFARREVMAQIEKIRDFYNLDRLAQAGAEAALRDRQWLRETTGKIVATRERTIKAVRALGVRAYNSKTNFILIRLPSVAEADRVFAELGRNKVLTRRFPKMHPPECIRVTIGTDSDMDTFLLELGKAIV